MSMSTHTIARKRNAVSPCLGHARIRKQGAQLAFMANRYFERAKELEQEVRFQSIPILHHEEARMG